MPIKDFHFHNGVVSITSLNLPLSFAFTVRFKEIKYIEVDTLQEVIFDKNVKIIADDTHSTLKLDDQHYAGPEIKDIAYLLTPTSVFRTLIARVGFDLRVGEFVSTEVLGKGKSADCLPATDVKDVVAFETVFKVKIHDFLGNHYTTPIPNDKKSSFYEVLSREVLDCSYQDKKFLRILNKIKVLEPVREIETYDGVEIVETLLEEIHAKSVIIFEKKYLDIHTYEPIKYGGDIKINSQDNAQRTLAARLSSISISIDDSVQLTGSYIPERLPLPNDYQNRESDESIYTGTVKIKEEGAGKTLRFKNLTFDEEILDQYQQVLCTQQESSGKKYLSSFEIFSSHATIKTVYSHDEEGNNDLFTPIAYEEWLCQENKLDGKVKFRRIVNSQRLKSKSEWNIVAISNFPTKNVYFETNGTSVDVIVNEIKYLDATTPSKVLNYKGMIILAGTTLSITTNKLLSGGEMISDSKYEDNLLRNYYGVKLMEYNLNNRFYRIILQSEGASLEIGTRWQDKFEDSASMNCHLHNIDESEKNSYRTRTVNRESTEDIFHQYFDNIKSLEVWNCNNEKGNNMLRVVNQFKVKPLQFRSIKELFFHDGITMDYALDGGNHWLAITEVKYINSTTHQVLKFDGDLRLMGDTTKVSESITISRSPLANGKKIDLHDTLGEKALRRKVLRQGAGEIIEIGQVHDRRVADSYQPFVCGYPTIVSNYENFENIKPIIKIYRNDTENYKKPELPSWSELENDFSLTSRYWSCKKNGGSETIYRVENIMVNKATADLKVVQLNHHKGVTISSERNGGALTIKEIKYLAILSDTHSLEIDGIVAFEDKSRDSDRSEITTPLVVREMNEYFLDTDVFNIAGPYLLNEDKNNLNGVIYEVGSSWKIKLEATNQAVICEKNINHMYSSEHGMRVFGFSEAPKSWSILPSSTFEGVVQDSWTCKRDDQTVFYRVVNYMVVTKNVQHIYYQDGVSVNWLHLPDTTKSVQMREVKFVHPETFEVVKYVGELKIVTGVKSGHHIMQKMFPLDWDVKLPAPVNDLSVDYISLNALRVLVNRKKGNQIEDDTFKRTPQYPLHVVRQITRGGFRNVSIGTSSDEMYDSSNTMKCMPYEWNSKYRTQYVPAVADFVKGLKYELDDQLFRRSFTIDNQKVWFCMHGQDVVFRIVTDFSPIEGFATSILVATLHEGVDFKKTYFPEKVTFSETVFINARTHKYWKYRGTINEIDLTKRESLINCVLDKFSGLRDYYSSLTEVPGN